MGNISLLGFKQKKPRTNLLMIDTEQSENTPLVVIVSTKLIQR